MKPLTCEEIRKVLRGRWLTRGQQGTVSAVSINSRTAKPGDLFVALKGERFDAHDYLLQAGSSLCAAAVVRADYRPSPVMATLFRCGVIGVTDTTAAPGDLASHCRTHLSATVIGVTGSNGKTTVKRMIHHILGKRLAGSCSVKSFNNQVGLPLSLLAVGPSDQYVACELGTSAPGEIAALARVCRPDIAVITFVGPAHLERLVSLEGVATEKASILTALTRGGVGVVWGDSEPLARTLRAHRCPLIRFGESDGCQLRLTACQPLAAGQRFEVNGKFQATMPVVGRHNALNALAAIAVAARLGFELPEAAAALADFPGTEMRLQVIPAGAVTIINDAYNANPASMAAAATVLAERPGARRVMIAGDMRELGPEAAELHYQLGRRIGAQRIDLVVGVGELGRHIARGAGECGLATEVFASVEAAAAAVGALVRAGDVVLIKGSRAMAMERLVAPLQRAFCPTESASFGAAGASADRQEPSP